ncbi:F-box/LRR-repeat protein At5g63520 [Cajanus cajan]|uniref:F-box/LRR-repeat protein At5g63520 n=1 Tax=Cajanus cajan TaxID=3821 RepID=UPI00098DA0E5|nr:F-box/LRR-repeat protein At5g63520 [Cajanus cajan]
MVPTQRNGDDASDICNEVGISFCDRGDEEYLYVDGIGIKTGDFFQFYYSDPNTALASLTKVHDALKNIKLERNSKDFKGDGDSATNVFGGLIFACYGRGESFFGRNNVDSSPFLENFPGVPVSGIFCGGEMVRPCTTVIGQCQGASPKLVAAYMFSMNNKSMLMI